MQVKSGRSTQANRYMDKTNSSELEHHQENDYESHFVLSNIFNGDVDEVLKNSSGGQVSRARIRTHTIWSTAKWDLLVASRQDLESGSPNQLH